MERMGHSSTRAALVYLHSTSERQLAIADAVSKQARAALRKAKAQKFDTDKAKNDQVKADPDGTDTDKPCGTKVARRRLRAGLEGAFRLLEGRRDILKLPLTWGSATEGLSAPGRIRTRGPLLRRHRVLSEMLSVNSLLATCSMKSEMLSSSISSKFEAVCLARAS
jgi:hypothetical protein